jgi:hypothetical protein
MMGAKEMTGASASFPIFPVSVKEFLKRFNSREMHGMWQTKKTRLIGGDERGRRKINAF